MNTIWSDKVQSIDCLYTSRKFRFSDRFRERFTPFFAIPENARVLEIGCGPGALCESLSRWYPDASIIGADKDSNFISFAKHHIRGVTFLEEDATALSFPAESFNVTISNTVSEHIAPDAFFGEQHRVLKQGGICLLISARRGISRLAPCIEEETEFEKSVWARVMPRLDEIDRTLGICAYPMTEQELPLAMERYGFSDVSVEYTVLHTTPDDPSYDKETARAIIESERASGLNAVNGLIYKVPELVTEEEIGTLRSIINEKYDTRLALYEKGEKQWDTYISLTMMLLGVKK